MSDVTINRDLQALISPLSAEEFEQLEQNILAHGCRDALVIWQESNTLLDGHNRFAICKQHGLLYTTTAIALPNLDAAKAWMLANQLGRRNLTERQVKYFRGKQYELEKDQGKRTDLICAQNAHKSKGEKAATRLARQHNVDPATIRRDAEFARAVDAVTEAVGPEARHAILASDTKMTNKAVKALGEIAEASKETAKHVIEAVQSIAKESEATHIVREAAKALPVLTLTQDEPSQSSLEEIPTADGRMLYVMRKPDSRPVFNKTNEMVDWAAWTWNPVTGCWHGCDYCYAREIANNQRMADAYPKQFEPTFHPARLDAPANTKVPSILERPADKNVFTCSMADLFGKWVPEAWIMAVFERVILHTEWNFLFLTKFPRRLQEICDALGGFPDNAWVGCTVDAQARVSSAEKAFRHIKAKVRWLSVEPMRERLTFTKLDMFDWVVMGGQSASYFNKTPAMQPEWEWVEHLWRQARIAGVKVYWKENLTIRPKETPWVQVSA